MGRTQGQRWGHPGHLAPCTRRLTTLLATPKRLEATQW